MIDVPEGSIEVDDPREVLRNTEGLFEVTSPYGQVFQVNCRRGSKMSVRTLSETNHTRTPERTWRIRRIDRSVA